MTPNPAMTLALTWRLNVAEFALLLGWWAFVLIVVGAFVSGAVQLVGEDRINRFWR